MYKFLDWINVDKINWSWLSANISDRSIYILEKSLDKIDWFCLSFNKNIFKLDYKFLKNRIDIIREE